MVPRTPSSTGQHLFTPVSHPELHTLGRKNIHTFLRQRERYLLKVGDANAAGPTITPTTLKSSVDTELLLSLVALEEFPGAETIQDVTEDQVKTWLNAKDDVELHNLSLDEREASILASVRVKIHEPDASLRIIALFSD